VLTGDKNGRMGALTDRVLINLSFFCAAFKQRIGRESSFSFQCSCEIVSYNYH
jgi:hypothetical protein